MPGKKNYELEILISGGTDASLAASIKRARAQIDSLEQKAGLTSQGISNAFGKSAKGIEDLGNLSDRFFDGIVKGSKLAAAGIGAISAAAIGVGMGFEAQMSTVQSIGQVSEEDMKRLKAVAEEMGATTQFTAKEAGQGLEYMASAGWSTQQMIDGLPGVMYMAAASGESLALSSDIVTGTLTAFGKEAGEAARLADVLAMASAATNTDVAGLGLALEYVAPVAGALAYSYEDVAIAIGMMSNANIKGEKAGTAMRTMLTNLAKPTNDMLGYMEDLGISLTDSEGKMIPLRQVLADIREGFSGLTEAERAEYAAGIAGKEGMSGLLAIVNTAQEDFETLTQRIDNSTGAAQEMFQVRMDNLAGDIELFKSAAEGAGIEFYEGVSGDLRELVQVGTEAVGNLTDSLREDMPTLRRHAKEAAAVIGEFADPVMEVGNWFLKHPQAIKGGILGIASAMAVFKTAKTGMQLMTQLSGLITAWPVAVAGLAVGGIIGIGTAIEETGRIAAEQDLAERFGDISLSMEDLEQAAKQTLGFELFDGIDAFEQASGQSEELKRSIQQAIMEINRTGWKLSLGIELGETDVQSYVSQVEQFVETSQEYIESRGYELELAVQLVMGEGEGAQELTAGNHAFYQSLLAQLQPLKEQINQALSDVTEEGLTLPKEQIISGYLEQISDITQMITDAQNAAELQLIQGKFSGISLDKDSFQNYQQELAAWNEQAMAGLDESYKTILSTLYYRREAGTKGMEGGISQEEFDEQYAQVSADYFAKKLETTRQGYQAMQDTLLAAYPELEGALGELDGKVSEIMESWAREGGQNPQDWEWMMEAAVGQVMDASGLTDTQKRGATMILEGMKPTAEQLQEILTQYEKAGGENGNAYVQAAQEALNEGIKLEALSGSREAAEEVLGAGALQNSEEMEFFVKVRESGGRIPENVAKEIDENQSAVTEAVGRMRNETESQLEQQFKEFHAIGNVFIDLIPSLRLEKVADGSNVKKKIAYNAKGGLIKEPTLSWFAEEGPEMAIPLDGSDRALSLWQEAGELLGAYESSRYSNTIQTLRETEAASPSRSSSFAPVFSPVIYVSSENARQEVMSGLSAGYEQFKEMMEQYQMERARVSF